MRKVITLSSVACLLLFVVSCAPSTRSQLVGKWTESSKPAFAATSYVFNNDGSASILMGDRIVKEGLSWKLNASYSPMHLDLTGTAGPNNDTITVQMILGFEADNIINICESGDPNIRPTSFEQSKPFGNKTLERVVD